MSRPILNIVDEKVVLTLTVQDNAAKAAAASAAAAAASEVQTGLDAVATGEDRVATGEDRVQTGLDRIATAADRVQTELDAIATNADRTQTGLDAIATAADRVQTGLDRIATGEDRVETGLDRIATGEDANLSQAWAESPTEPAGVGTKSSLTSANESKAARDEIVAKVDFTGAIENDLLQANGAGVFEAKSTELAIARGYYKMKCALNPVFVMQNGTILTGNGGTTAFVEPISSLSYLKLSDLTPLISNNGTPMYINVVGLIGASIPAIKGIILGVDDLNYIELIWNRNNNASIFRRIEAGIVVTTATFSIGTAIRSTPYQLEVNFGGEGSRTGIGYFIKCIRPPVNHFFDNTDLEIRKNITFIAFANILNSPFDAQHNIGICGTKFS